MQNKQLPEQIQEARSVTGGRSCRSGSTSREKKSDSRNRYQAKMSQETKGAHCNHCDILGKGHTCTWGEEP